MSKDDDSGKKILTKNRKAYHDFSVLDSFEAGIALQGTEVKSLRAGGINLKDSYADIIRGEIWLVGVHINPYEQGNIYNHDPERRRKLLMHKQEIVRLAAQVAEKGLTLVPLSVYFRGGRVKVEIGLCRGKKTHDKRDAIRERDVKREMAQAIRNAQRS